VPSICSALFEYIIICCNLVSEGHFFPEFRKVVIVGDSMIKNLPPIEGVEVKAVRGATIGKINFLIEKGQLSLGSNNYVIVHAGTNNIANGNSCDYILSGLANLVATIRRVNPNIHIIISSILPRPVDKVETESVIKEVNSRLEKEMSKDLNFKFVKSFRPFLYKGQIKRYLFANLDGGLHLNSEGSNRLGHFFLRVISTLNY
jgi:lysophospholipase L1-like esterase